MIEKRTQRGSLQVPRRSQPSKLRQRGIDIDQFHHRLGPRSCFRQTRRMNDEGDLGPDIKEGHLSPEEVISEVVTVIRGENDDGILPLPALFKRIKHDLDLGIDE